MARTGQKILIVDDNDDNLTLLEAVLKLEGYQVTGVPDAPAARAALAVSLPDLILMDLQLPRVDGYTLTREFKADPRTKHIPIIAITAAVMPGDEDKARRAGCDGYISKPIDTQSLPQVIAGYFTH